MTGDYGIQITQVLLNHNTLKISLWLSSKNPGVVFGILPLGTVRGAGKYCLLCTKNLIGRHFLPNLELPMKLHSYLQFGFRFQFTLRRVSVRLFQIKEDWVALKLLPNSS